MKRTIFTEDLTKMDLLSETVPPPTASAGEDPWQFENDVADGAVADQKAHYESRGEEVIVEDFTGHGTTGAEETTQDIAHRRKPVAGEITEDDNDDTDSTSGTDSTDDSASTSGADSTSDPGGVAAATTTTTTTPSGVEQIIAHDGFENGDQSAQSQLRQMGAAERYDIGAAPSDPAGGVTTRQGEDPAALQARLLAESAASSPVTDSTGWTPMEDGSLTNSSSGANRVLSFNGVAYHPKGSHTAASVTQQMLDEGFATHVPGFNTFTDDQRVAVRSYYSHFGNNLDQLNQMARENPYGSSAAADHLTDPNLYVQKTFERMSTQGVQITQTEQDDFGNVRNTTTARLQDVITNDCETRDQEWSLALHASQSDMETMYEFGRWATGQTGTGTTTPAETIDEVLSRTGDEAVVQNADQVKSGIDTVRAEDQRQIEEMEAQNRSDFAVADQAYNDRVITINNFDSKSLREQTDALIDSQTGDTRTNLLLGRERNLSHQIDHFGEDDDERSELRDLRQERRHVRGLYDDKDDSYKSRCDAIDQRVSDANEFDTNVAAALSSGQDRTAQSLINGRADKIGLDMQDVKVRVTDGAGQELKAKSGKFAKFMEGANKVIDVPSKIADLGTKGIGAVTSLMSSIKSLKGENKNATKADSKSKAQERADRIAERAYGEDGKGRESLLGKVTGAENFGKGSEFAKNTLFGKDGKLQQSYKERHDDDKGMADRFASREQAVSEADSAATEARRAHTEDVSEHPYDDIEDRDKH